MKRRDFRGLRELQGAARVPKEFGEFESALQSFPGGSLVGTKALFLKDFMGNHEISLKDSFIGMKSRASGSLRLELQGTSFLKRIITIPKGKELNLSYVSRRSASVVDDTIYLQEDARLVYDGRFKIGSGEFINTVRVVHAKPRGSSEVSIRGLARGSAKILPTGEFLRGSEGSKTDINGFAVLFGKGRVDATPELLINDPGVRAYHSFKKLHMDSEQLFYIASRGLRENNIEALYERLILGG